MLQPHKKFSSYTGWKGHIYAAKELNAVIYLAALNSTYRPNTRPGMHSGQPQKHQLGTASSAQLQERVAAPQGCGAMVVTPVVALSHSSARCTEHGLILPISTQNICACVSWLGAGQHCKETARAATAGCSQDGQQGSKAQRQLCAP